MEAEAGSRIHPGGAFDGDINLVLAFIIDVLLTHVSSLWTHHLLLNELRMGIVAVCNKADLVLLSSQTCFLGTYTSTKVNVVLGWTLFTDKYTL